MSITKLMKVFVDGRLVGARFHAAHRISGAGHGLDRLHGHTYEVGVEVIGDDDDFIYPFERLVEIASSIVGELNNKVLLAGGGGNVIKHEGDHLLYISSDNKRYLIPLEDVAILPLREITAEALASYLAGRIVDEISRDGGYVKKVREVVLTLWEGFERGVVVSRGVKTR